MSSLTAHDRYVQAPYADAEDAPDDSEIIEEMMGNEDMAGDFVRDVAESDPTLAYFMSLLLTRGFPTKDESERDDEYRDRLDALLEALREQFSAWANEPWKYGASSETRVVRFAEWKA